MPIYSHEHAFAASASGCSSPRGACPHPGSMHSVINLPLTTWVNAHVLTLCIVYLLRVVLGKGGWTFAFAATITKLQVETKQAITVL